MSNILRQVRRDLSASPKKAALLGTLVLVALWFWAPLVIKMVTGGKPAAKTAPTPAKTETAQAADVPAKPAAPQPTWQETWSHIQNDPNMQPTVASDKTRDPFGTDRAEHQLTAEEEAKRTEVTPVEAGIELKSTIVGFNRKTALVDGRAYQEGQTIISAKGQDEFELVEIHPRHVVLERNGTRYELRIPNVDLNTSKVK